MRKMLYNHYYTEIFKSSFEDEYFNRVESPILTGTNGGLNIIVTPHIGGMTWEGQQKAYRWAIDKLKGLK